MNLEIIHSRPLLSVIIPAYNELRTIEEALQRVFDVCIDKQIIVVDDGSDDGTADVLKKWASAGRIELLMHDRNCGKGSAIRTALVRAQGTYTIIQDADLEYDPHDYTALLELLLRLEADVVYGSRYSCSDLTNPDPNWVLRGGVRLLNWTVRMLYGVQLSDEATCYKVFPTDLLQKLDLKCEGFEFCPEVTAKICRLGLRIKEVPISYRRRTYRAGKKLRARDGLTAMQVLWRLRNWEPTTVEAITRPR